MVVDIFAQFSHSVVCFTFLACPLLAADYAELVREISRRLRIVWDLEIWQPHLLMFGGLHSSCVSSLKVRVEIYLVC
jgi:hypothetical protein